MSLTGNIIHTAELIGANGGNLIIDFIAFVFSLYLLVITFFSFKRLKGRLSSNLLYCALTLFSLNLFIVLLSDLYIIQPIPIFAGIINFLILTIFIFYFYGVREEIIECDRKLRKK